MPALERCVGDVTLFFERHWGASPLLLPPRGDGFDDLASLRDLDQMIASMGLDASSLRMVRRGKALPPADYTASPGKSRVPRQPLVSAPLVLRRYEEGATIVLESLHRFWRPVTDFCRQLELSLGHRLQVNAYITPPGSQGFDVHVDDHDVFVLQVSGSKHWIVYDRHDPERVLIDREIEPGSALYIPIGYPHAATTAATASAHLTVGILTHDSIDVIRELAKAAEDQPAFQERLDLRGVRDAASLREVVEREVDELRTWLDKVDMDDLTERVGRRVLSSAQPIAAGILEQIALLDRVDASSAVARRRGAICVLFPRDTSLKVLLADRELEMPLVAQRAMQHVVRNETFVVRDLHQMLDPASAMVLVRRLIREGLLEVVVDA